MAGLKVLVVYANCMMDNLIPVGVSALIGSLKAAGVQVELFDTTFYRTEDRPSDVDRVDNLQVAAFNYADAGLKIKDADVHESFRQHVLRYRPDVIMLSVVEVTHEQGLGLLRAVSDVRPFTLVGGVYAILAPDEVLANELVDAVCVGEGEDAAVEFCRRFAAGQDHTGVQGMWFKRDGAIVRNPPDHLVDLDASAHMDFSLFEKERFFKPMQGRIFRMVPLEFSRGCPYRCTYCANHALERHFKLLGKWYRWRSLDRIFAEIEDYVGRYNIEFFYFVSESFLSMPAEKFDEFCDRYSKHRIPFWFNTRPETINERVLRRLEDIGCFRMGIGLEHGNQEFRRKILGRGASNDRIVAACKMVEASKISYSINNMIGFPGETRELVMDTIMLNRRIQPDSVGTFVFTPFRGTDLYDYCLEHGHIDPVAKAGDLNRGSVLRNNTLSADEIKGLLRTFPLYVHFPEEMFPAIRRAEALTPEGNAAFDELARRYVAEHFGGGRK